MHSDADDVIRRVPMSFTVDGEQVPSMAAELVARASEPTSDPVFARLPRPTPDMLILNFQGGADDVPTYSLADLAACAAKDDKNFFKRNFGGAMRGRTSPSNHSWRGHVDSTGVLEHSKGTGWNVWRPERSHSRSRERSRSRAAGNNKRPGPGSESPSFQERQGETRTRGGIAWAAEANQ